MRPASVGLLPKHADFDGNDSTTASIESNQENVFNNNTAEAVAAAATASSPKRRSKSASATQRNSVTFSDTVMVQPVKRNTPTASRRTYHEDTHGYRNQM